eukprot:1101858-Amorphochlora_amoeboformis.AAC.2
MSTPEAQIAPDDDAKPQSEPVKEIPHVVSGGYRYKCVIGEVFKLCNRAFSRLDVPRHKQPKLRLSIKPRIHRVPDRSMQLPFLSKAMNEEEEEEKGHEAIAMVNEVLLVEDECNPAGKCFDFCNQSSLMGELSSYLKVMSHKRRTNTISILEAGHDDSLKKLVEDLFKSTFYRSPYIPEKISIVVTEGHTDIQATNFSWEKISWRSVLKRLGGSHVPCPYVNLEPFWNSEKFQVMLSQHVKSNNFLRCKSIDNLSNDSPEDDFQQPSENFDAYDTLQEKLQHYQNLLRLLPSPKEFNLQSLVSRHPLPPQASRSRKRPRWKIDNEKRIKSPSGYKHSTDDQLEHYIFMRSGVIPTKERKGLEAIQNDKITVGIDPNVEDYLREVRRISDPVIRFLKGKRLVSNSFSISDRRSRKKAWELILEKSKKLERAFKAAKSYGIASVGGIDERSLSQLCILYYCCSMAESINFPPTEHTWF